MMICVLGRQPEIGLAELEALYGSDHVKRAGHTCALVDVPVDFPRLGGTVKVAELLATVSGDRLKAAFRRVSQLMPEIVKKTPADGKLKLGLSTYGFGISPYALNGEALRLKKAVRSTGRSVRVVPSEDSALSSAQTYHNQLAGPLGIEIILVQTENGILVGRVTDVQNIDGYRIRDRERPKRDAFVGMLPPKLAQIIVNLAAGQRDLGSQISDLGEAQKTENTAHPSKNQGLQSKICILDPFCGTGVILQEALLMGYDVYGTDLSPKMVDYTTANLEWLQQDLSSKSLDLRKSQMNENKPLIQPADATTYQWPILRSQISDLKSSVAIATETYLGQPLGGQHPSEEKLSQIVHETNDTIRQFLKNMATQIPTGTRLCLAVPAWFVNATPTRLPLTDELPELGYAQQTFSHTITPLIYHRESQVTGRELLVLIKE